VRHERLHRHTLAALDRRLHSEALVSFHGLDQATNRQRYRSHAYGMWPQPIYHTWYLYRGVVSDAIHCPLVGYLKDLSLAGVVVNDSLVLVSHLNRLRNKLKEQSKSISRERMRRLVSRGTAERLRAIVLTTLTTAAGMLPLAYGLGGHDLYMAPMALVLGYGLLFATPLTLLLVPSLYLIGQDVRILLGPRRSPAALAGIRS